MTWKSSGRMSLLASASAAGLCLAQGACLAKGAPVPSGWWKLDGTVRAVAPRGGLGAGALQQKLKIRSPSYSWLNAAFLPKFSLDNCRWSAVYYPKHGAVAQLGERFVRIEEVRGSNPLSSILPEGIIYCRF